MNNDEVSDKTPPTPKLKPKRRVKNLPKPNRGRPKKLKPGSQTIFKLPSLEQVFEYGRLGMTIKQVADALGCSYSHIFTVFSDYESLRVEYLRGRADGICSKLRKLDEHVESDHKGALFFWLERIGGFAAKADLTMREPDQPLIDLSPEQQAAMARVVLDAVVVPRGTLTGDRVSLAIEQGPKELRGELAETDSGIEAETREGRMLLRNKPEGGRIGDRERVEIDTPSDPASSKPVELVTRVEHEPR